MKFNVVFTAKYYADVEADNKGEASKIALDMQNSEKFKNNLVFEEPFVLCMQSFTQGDDKKAEQEYKNFIDKYPKFEKKLKKANKHIAKLAKKFKKQKPVERFFSKEEISGYSDYISKYGFSHYNQADSAGFENGSMWINLLISFMAGGIDVRTTKC